jgi:hypothetical protein
VAPEWQQVTLGATIKKGEEATITPGITLDGNSLAMEIS